MAVSLMEGLEIIKVSGLVAGGLWTAWTFRELQKRRQAEVDIRKAELGINQTRSEIEKSRMERQEMVTRLLQQQPQPTIDLKVVEVVRFEGSAKHCLAVTVVIKNDGERNFSAEFHESTLIVGRITFGKGGKQTIEELHRSAPVFIDESSDEPKKLTDRVFRVGQRRQMVFAIPITELGAYFIQFYAVYVKVPFEGEKVSAKKDSTAIAAIEQTIHFATGKPSES